jgi:hypothetical protein
MTSDARVSPPVPVEPRTGGPWLTMTEREMSLYRAIAAGHEGEDPPQEDDIEALVNECDAQRAESTALRSRLADVEPELSAIAYRVRKDDCCPTANNEGDEGEATYICLGEDGTPIIEADRLADVVAGIIHCWGKTQDRAERAEARLADVVKIAEEAMERASYAATQIEDPIRKGMVTAHVAELSGKLSSLTPGGDRGT